MLPGGRSARKSFFFLIGHSSRRFQEKISLNLARHRHAPGGAAGVHHPAVRGDAAAQGGRGRVRKPGLVVGRR